MNIDVREREVRMANSNRVPQGWAREHPARESRYSDLDIQVPVNTEVVHGDRGLLERIVGLTVVINNRAYTFG